MKKFVKNDRNQVVTPSIYDNLEIFEIPGVFGEEDFFPSAPTMGITEFPSRDYRIRANQEGPKLLEETSLVYSTVFHPLVLS